MEEIENRQPAISHEENDEFTCIKLEKIESLDWAACFSAWLLDQDDRKCHGRCLTFYKGKGRGGEGREEEKNSTWNKDQDFGLEKKPEGKRKYLVEFFMFKKI